MITEVAAISRRQLQNSQLHSAGRASRCRRAHGISAVPSKFPLIITEKMAKEGYQSMLQNLIRFLKDGRKCWVKLSCLPSVYYRVSQKSILFKSENLISFISDKAYLKLDFDCKKKMKSCVNSKQDISEIM